MKQARADEGCGRVLAKQGWPAGGKKKTSRQLSLSIFQHGNKEGCGDFVEGGFVVRQLEGADSFSGFVTCRSCAHGVDFIAIEKLFVQLGSSWWAVPHLPNPRDAAPWHCCDT